MSSSQATLLGIPQELRNKIFEHVYSDYGTTASHILADLVNVFNVQGDVRVQVASCHSPPSKDAILVCRQIYTEIKKMQAAACRRHWSESTFNINFVESPSNSPAEAYICPGRDLQHAKHFILRTHYRGSLIACHLDFQLGKWTIWFHASERGWYGLVPGPGWPPEPQGPQRLAYFEDELRAYGVPAPFSLGRETVDPELGLGFAAIDLGLAALAAATLMSTGSFQPL